MRREHVMVKCDVYCDWQDQPPVYRLYVGNELFVERTYIWQTQYLEESIPVCARPGKYEIRYELVEPSRAQLKIKNLRVDSGPPSARIMKNTLLRIYPHEST